MRFSSAQKTRLARAARNALVESPVLKSRTQRLAAAETGMHRHRPPFFTFTRSI